MEYWSGWFDHWFEQHHTTTPNQFAQVLETVFANYNGSVNFYMFHGGTNFGFWNGANYNSYYEPTVTSYDYDSPISESGDPTEKYLMVKQVIKKYMTVPEEDPQPAPKRNYGAVKLDQYANILNASNLLVLSTAQQRPTPDPMEFLGQDFGFILYRTHVNGPLNGVQLNVNEVRDRALIYLDGVYQGLLERSNPSESVNLNIPVGGAQLDIFVENMGRINYGSLIKDYKGISEGVQLDYQFVFNWTIFPIDMEDLSGLQYSEVQSNTSNNPAFYKGTFTVDSPVLDTFLSLPGWIKGVAFLNGFNLGRYWNRGPQRTLYCPAPLLQLGDNEIVIFEIHGFQDNSVEFVEFPDLG